MITVIAGTAPSIQEQWRQNASSGMSSGLPTGITAGMPSVLSDRSKDIASTQWPPRAQPESVGLTRQVEAAPWAGIPSAGIPSAGIPSAGIPSSGTPSTAAMAMRPPQNPTLSAGQFMMNPQLMASPHNQAFLASATNLMMGMGLPGTAGTRSGEARFDAYKGVPGAQLPRY